MHGLGVVMHDDTKGMFSCYLWFVCDFARKTQKMFLMVEIIRSKILPHRGVASKHGFSSERLPSSSPPQHCQMLVQPSKQGAFAVESS